MSTARVERLQLTSEDVPVNGRSNGNGRGATTMDGATEQSGGDVSAAAAAAAYNKLFVSQVPAPPFLRLANPGPLGLIGFALTTFALGLYQCGAG